MAVRNFISPFRVETPKVKIGKQETSDNKSPSSSNCIALCSVHSRHVVGHPLDCGHIGVHGPLGRGVHVATRIPHREVHKAEAGS